jgi:hypothetical protein
MPAAVIATRVVTLFPFPELVLGILGKNVGPRFSIAFLMEAFY